MSSVALAVTVVLVILLIAVTANMASKRYDGYLEGLWAGDPGFLEESQLSDFQLYIGPRKGRKREGYLLMADTTGAFVANQAIEIEEPRSRWLSALRNVFKAKDDKYMLHHVRFTYTNGDEPMPSEMRLTLSILNGTLTLHDGEKLYAFLEKDIAASAAAAEVAALPAN